MNRHLNVIIDYGLWIEWDGKTNSPPIGNVRFSYCPRVGAIVEDSPIKASDINWLHSGSDSDIVAYCVRVIDEEASTLLDACDSWQRVKKIVSSKALSKDDEHELYMQHELFGLFAAMLKVNPWKK